MPKPSAQPAQISATLRMQYFIRQKRRLTFAIALFLGAVASSADVTEQRLIKRAAKIRSTIENVQASETSSIPAGVIKNAKGVIILRQFEAGFVLGGKGGFGMAFKRLDDGSWGAPAWIKTGEGSWGLQIGAQTLNVVLLIMDEKGLKMLEKAKFRIGVDAAVTAGPTGRTAEAKTGANSPILAYTDTEGLYAGATFEGGFLLPDHKSNLATYEEWLSVPEIISNSNLSIPEYAADIVALLAMIEKAPKD